MAFIAIAYMATQIAIVVVVIAVVTNPFTFNLYVKSTES